jgi:hypothetical protein
MTRWMDGTDGRMDDETDGWNDASWRPVLYNITRKRKKQNAFATPTFVKEKLYLHNDLSCEPFVCEFGGHLKKWNALCTVTCPLLKLPPFWKFSQPCSLRWEIPSGGGRPFMPWTLSSALGYHTADFWRMLYDDEWGQPVVTPLQSPGPAPPSRRPPPLPSRDLDFKTWSCTSVEVLKSRSTPGRTDRHHVTLRTSISRPGLVKWGQPVATSLQPPDPPPFVVVIVLLFHLGTSISKLGSVRPSRFWNQDRHLNE